MKKRTYLLAASMAFTVASMAQTAPNAAPPMQNKAMKKEEPPKTPQERAEKMTQHLTKKLNLTAQQQDEALKINLNAATKMENLKKEGDAKKESRKAQKEAINNNRDAQLKALFTPEQAAAFTKMREEEKMKHDQEKEKHDGK